MSERFEGMTYPLDTSAPPPPPPPPPAAAAAALYPPPAPGPAPPLVAAAAAAPTAPSSSSSFASSTVATSAGGTIGPTSEEKRPLSGFGSGSFGSSASSGFGGAAFGSCSVPASAATTAGSTSNSGGFSFSGLSFGSSSSAFSSSTGFGSSLFCSSSVPPATATTASFSGGFGGTTAGFGGPMFGSFTAQPAASTTTSSLFGHVDPPVSTSSSKSPFGLPAGHQPSVATPAPSATSAFGCSVRYPHPSTFQVPPSSETFERPFVPVTPAPSVPDVKKPEEPKPTAAPAATKKDAEKKKKPVSALVVAEAEGSARFPSRNDAEFRYRFTLTKGDRIKVWIEDRASKHQWESKELELSEIVPADRAIPMMELSDYFECFKSCLLASNTGLFKGPSKHDLVLPLTDKDNEKSTGSSASDDVQLQLTIGVCVFAKVFSSTYSFTLHPVELSEMDIVNTKICDQDEEIENLRAQLAALASKMENATPSNELFGTAVTANPFSTHNASPLYIRAETTDTTFSNQSMIWTKMGEASWLFGGICQVDVSGGIKFTWEGLYNIQIVVHHTNSYDPENNNANNGPFGVVWTQREAFVLQKNGQPIGSNFGSTLKGTIQSSQLHHILPLKPSDELRVVYTGAGAAKAGSYIFINQIK